MKTVKDKLYHFEETPPDKMWEAISANVTMGKEISLHKRRRTKWIAFSTAAAAVVILFLINFLFVNRHESTIQDGVATTASAPDSVERNKELLDAIINAPANKKLTESSNLISEGIMRYFTIEGPEGEPVKISPKVATLIISADNDYPPKPVWDKKIDEWQKIMLTSHASYTSSNLLEIIMKAGQTMN